MLIKLGAVVILTPVFFLPGLLVALIGGICGQIYMKAQLPVKREMSNAKAPVLGQYVFLANMFNVPGMTFSLALVLLSLGSVSLFPPVSIFYSTLYSLSSCLRSTGGVHERIHDPDQRVHTRCQNLL